MEYPFDSFEGLQPFIGHPDIKKGKKPLRKCHVCDVTLTKSSKVLDCHVKNNVREHYNQCVETRNIFVECSELRIDILENHERFKEGPVCSFCGKQNLKIWARCIRLKGFHESAFPTLIELFHLEFSALEQSPAVLSLSELSCKRWQQSRMRFSSASKTVEQSLSYFLVKI